ncbi:type VII secretion target [Rhodococcus sp. NPDC003322]
MSEFRVDPDDVDSFAATLATLASQTQQAKDYLHKWLQIGYAEGRMFAPVVEKVSDVLAELDPAYTGLATLSADAGAELNRAARSYREMEAANAANLDAAYEVA